MKDQEKKLRKQSHLPSQQKQKKIPREYTYLRRQKTYTQRTLRYWWQKSKTTQLDEEINHVLGLAESKLWERLYHPKQSTDSMNGIPIKLPVAFFTKLGQNIFKVSMETQKASNSQSNLEKEKWSWRNQASDFRLYYQQSYSNQDSIILAQKQKYRSMEQDLYRIYTGSMEPSRKPTDEPIQLWSPNLWQKKQ